MRGRVARRLLSTLPDSSPQAATVVRRRLPAAKLPALSYDENLALRQRHLAPALKMHYQASEAGPIKLVSGQGQYLYDANGERYLDCVNNVCHVGHCHPRIVTAAATQLSMLNTNSRYMHDNIVRLAAEVAEVMPDPLSVCFFVNSGSEANDLALRLARAYTNRRDVYCVREAYHGNSASTLAISAYNKYAEVEAPDGSVYQDGFGKSRKWSPEEMEGQGQWTWYNPASWFGYGKIQEVHVNTGVNTGAGAA